MIDPAAAPPPLYVIARGMLADEGFPTLATAATRLLELLDAAGHGERSFKLRECNAARPVEPAGPCLAILVINDEGHVLDHGFAYLFMPYAADMRVRLEGALRAARPDDFVAPLPAKLQRSAA